MNRVNSYLKRLRQSHKTHLAIAISMLLAMTTHAQDNDHLFKVAKNLDVFNTIYKNLDMIYVDTLDADEVIGNGIDAMLRSLDPYTEYYSERKNKEVKMMLQGKYAGIGALIRYNYKLEDNIRKDNCN